MDRSRRGDDKRVENSFRVYPAPTGIHPPSKHLVNRSITLPFGVHNTHRLFLGDPNRMPHFITVKFVHRSYQCQRFHIHPMMENLCGEKLPKRQSTVWKLQQAARPGFFHIYLMSAWTERACTRMARFSISPPVPRWRLVNKSSAGVTPKRGFLHAYSRTHTDATSSRLFFSPLLMCVSCRN